MENEWGNAHLTDFTKFFLSRGVNPLHYFNKKIPDWCFYKMKIGENRVEIKEGIEYIGYSSFNNCLDLEEIILPKSLIETGSSVFKGCKKLNKVTFKSLPKLRGPLFSDNPNLKEVYFPKPDSKYEITATNWTVNHIFKNDINIDKLKIYYI